MTKTKEISFEEALSQLEATVRQMEAGDLGLDELLAKFETGIGLLRSCEKKLAEAQAKIEVLSKQAITAEADEVRVAEEADILEPPLAEAPPDDQGSLF
ncbi:MAG: exodeoxyribonuclease VII small subunit [Bacillota bacterium]|nr:exodeoxyribonuclease VII small subunit [Bacillota bacterium]